VIYWFTIKTKSDIQKILKEIENTFGSLCHMIIVTGEFPVRLIGNYRILVFKTCEHIIKLECPIEVMSEVIKILDDRNLF